MQCKQNGERSSRAQGSGSRRGHGGRAGGEAAVAGDGSPWAGREGMAEGGSGHMQPRMPVHLRREAAEPSARAAVRGCMPVPSAPSAVLQSERE